ncbi:uncharacterized protein LOC124148139 isoform X1 [Haliotis rufescens]|uniref:uncharacterized protein LOC124148139 isoform X1 n=1 Tax=Haliotis rufescens TaxID=6454 RepID=UPI00201F87B1|nr:uncharacterized protein LOC124148139 isoform X1 [Haliotis rufescens]
MELILIAITTVFYMAQAISFCSISNTTVHCFPCSAICTSNTNACFRCPINCTDPCEFVCSQWCLHQTCEYQRGQLICSEGCQDGRAGIFCQEFCAQDCQSCDQFTSECKEVIGSPKRTGAVSSEQWLVMGPVFAVILLLVIAAGLFYKRRCALGCLTRLLTFERRAISGISGHGPAMKEEDDSRCTREVTAPSTPAREYEGVGNIYVESVHMYVSVDHDQTHEYATPDFTQGKVDKEKYKYLTPIPQNLP